jgi:hypothetical protein
VNLPSKGKNPDATIFDRSVKHIYEPAPSMQKQDLPCILLYLQID